ncbi:conserved protein, unknown function, partial [Hepatocystis sp. ex Piliocolobus tephrosceles]
PNELSNILESGPYKTVNELKKYLLIYISSCFSNDLLVAHYFFFYLCGTYIEESKKSLGKITLSIFNLLADDIRSGKVSRTGKPCEVVKQSEEPKKSKLAKQTETVKQTKLVKKNDIHVESKTYPSYYQKIHDMFKNLVSLYRHIPFYLNKLNSESLISIMDYESGELKKGKLQLANNTYLVFDECVLETGKLNNISIKNFQSIEMLITSQLVPFVFTSDITFKTENNILGLSKKKSMFTNYYDISVPILHPHIQSGLFTEEKKNDNINAQKNDNINAQKNDNINEQKNDNINTQKNDNINAQKNDNINEQKNDNINTQKNDNINAQKNDNINAQKNDHVKAQTNDHVKAQTNDNTEIQNNLKEQRDINAPPKNTSDNHISNKNEKKKEKNYNDKFSTDFINTYTNYKPNKLELMQFRRYINYILSKTHCAKFTPDITKYITDTFVNLRQKHKEINQFVLNSYICMTRILAFSDGCHTISKNHWDFIIELESQRRLRLSNLDKVYVSTNSN